MPQTNDAYSDSVIVNYLEGDQSLERSSIVYQEDLNDKLHIVKEDELITAIAFRYYGKPSLWYIIADANNIINPLILDVGQQLVIPNIENYETTS